MELTGKLKKQVEQTTTKEEAKKVIEGAGMLLTDDELEQVSGGVQLRAGYDYRNIIDLRNKGLDETGEDLEDELGYR